MNKLAIILLFFYCTCQILAQDKMIVNKACKGDTWYRGYDIGISSINSLPPCIQYNVKGYLKRIIGSMSDSIKFSRGQIVDVKKYFCSDSSTYDYGWIIPKYDLAFELRDMSVGIECFGININLDEYGQILASNWPKYNYSDKTKFLPRIVIEQYALRLAKEKGYNTKSYMVDFEYNENLDKLCWIFKFPISVDDIKEKYNAIEIDWENTDNTREYKIESITLND